MSATRRWPLVLVAVIGVGLALAPLAFGMFERAPKGGDMLEGFGPYMTTGEIESFRGHLAEIGAARDEIAPRLVPGGAELPATRAFDAEWDAIDADMGGMLDTMEANLDEYEGVAALPPFPMFPWFFVVPGLLLVGAAGWAWRRPGARGPRVALVALGIGLLAAPATFQMFTRAPGGARMIADFEPMMTEQRVTAVQGYFLTLGSAEGELRQAVLPSATAGELPAVGALVADWQRTSADMAPMIGAMVDNLENYAAVAALPPFGLFPWFFVAPGVLVLALVAVGSTRSRTAAAVVTSVALAAGCAGGGSPAVDAGAAGADGAATSGLLGIAAGACDGPGATGSWFRMVQPGGTPDAGPYVTNPDSGCADQTVTGFTPGTDGGLRIGDFQPQPEPNFLADGTAAAAAVVQPQGFFAVRFGLSTNPVDPQTDEEHTAPTATIDGDRITVDLRSLAVSWNGQYFNQGAEASGAYDAATGAYVLDWMTTVEGGPFDGFTGIWHLAGTFTPT